MHWKCSKPFATQNHRLKLIQQMLLWDYMWYMGHIQYPMIPLWPTCPDAERNPCQIFSLSQSVLKQSDACIIKMRSSAFSIWENRLREFIFLLWNTRVWSLHNWTPLANKMSAAYLFVYVLFFFCFFLL